MSVLIKGMEMPESCFYCEFCCEVYRGGSVKLKCERLDKYIENNPYRMADCPLVEIPSEHDKLEPFINKPCVSEQACHEDKVKILDKIKAELERRGGNDEKAFCKNLNESYKLGLRQAIDVIDKYMAESEDKE